MKKLLILSGKGGTGKTTTAAAFIQFSKAKVIADCDVDAPNLHLVTNTDVKPIVSDFIGANKAWIDSKKCSICGRCMEYCRFQAVKKVDGVYQINEYACEGCGVCEFICPNQAVNLKRDIAGRLELYKDETLFSTAELKMGRGNSGKLVAAVKQQLFQEKKDADIAIIDGSPGIGCPVMASVTGMDMVLIVIEPTVSGLNDIKRLIASISMLQAKIAVCVNKWDDNPKQAEKVELFCKEQGILFAGKIPYDNNASAAINRGISLADIDCAARNALLEVYHKVLEVLD